MTSRTIAPAEQRAVLRNVSWKTYEQLLDEDPARRVPLFTYDQGVLEIMSPGKAHEGVAALVSLIVAEVAGMWRIDLADLRSTTFRQPDWERGFEPDGCFYVRDAAATVRTIDEIDPRVHPPPDIVVEVDITRSSTDKLVLFANFGIPEVWRYVGDCWEILHLDGRYAAIDESRVLPGLTTSALDELTADGLRSPQHEWLDRLRAWAARARPTP